MVRFCGNFYFNWRYCGFKTLSGVRLLQPLSHIFFGVIQVSAVIRRITWVHYISLQVLLTATVILWPPCTYGFSIGEKI